MGGVTNPRRSMRDTKIAVFEESVAFLGPARCASGAAVLQGIAYAP